MDSYEQKIRAERLQHYLKLRTYVPKDETDATDTKGQEALQWGAEHFFAKLLTKASIPAINVSEDRFWEFKERWEKQKGIEINAHELFEKFWLRRILGCVVLPSAVSGLCNTWESRRNYRSEIEFLVLLYDTIEGNFRRVDREVFDSALNSYNERIGTSIAVSQLIQNNWITERKDGLELQNMSQFFKPILEHWNQLDFLNDFKKLRYMGQTEELLIDEKEFNEIYEAQLNYFPNMPSIDTLKSDGFLSQVDETFSVNYRKVSFTFGQAFTDRTSGLVWQLLLRSERAVNDEGLLHEFVHKVLSGGRWPHTTQYLDSLAKTRFLNIGYNLIVESEDLNGIENEFYKLLGDHRDDLAILQADEHGRNYRIVDGSLFELFETLNTWEEQSQINLLTIQESRTELYYLIRALIQSDAEFEYGPLPVGMPHLVKGPQPFPRLFGLLEQAKSRPFLLWLLIREIPQVRVDFLPYMIQDERYASLAFECLKYLNLIYEDDRSFLTKNIWIQHIDILLPVLRSGSIERQVAARIVFEIFRVLNKGKYHIPFQHRSDESKNSRKEIIDLENSVLLKIENSPKYNHKVLGGEPEFLLPFIFDELVTCFLEFEEVDIYQNGTVAFPLLKWDSLSWMMKCSICWRYLNAIGTESTGKLAEGFLADYLKLVETNKKIQFYHFEAREVNKLPLWSEKLERLDKIEWIYPVYFINEIGGLNRFLNPDFIFESAEDEWHEQNRYSGDKLRTHIGVLLNALKEFRTPSLPYRFESSKVEIIKRAIEKQIRDYVHLHSQDVPREGKVDLFDDVRELGIDQTGRNALLPQLVRALNWFEYRDDVIQAIVDTQDLSKMLTLSEWITSEDIKNELIGRIKEFDVSQFLSASNGARIQDVLRRIRQYPDLIEQTKKIAKHWEENYARHHAAYAKELYQTQLVLAYFDGDEEKLNSIALDASSLYVSPSEFSPDDLKQFYRGLIRFNQNPEQSYSIFHELLKQRPQELSLAVNRMAAKIQMATMSDSINGYREALEEWRMYSESQGQPNEQALGDPFLSNKMEILFKLGEHEQLEQEYSQLDLSHRMLPNLLKWRIESLVKQDRHEAAADLIQEANTYHNIVGTGILLLQELRDKVAVLDTKARTPLKAGIVQESQEMSEQDFVPELHVMVPIPDSLDTLIGNYHRVFECTPDILVKVLPPKLNGRIGLQEYIAKEVAKAASEMVEKLEALPEIKNLSRTSKENRYTDLINLSLGSYLRAYGWRTKIQDRTGRSVGDKDLGEIDLRIDSDSQTVAICEAFRFIDKTRVQTHLDKLLRHYTHERNKLLILIYHEEPQNEFDKNWGTYRTWIPELKYPDGWELIDEPLEDMTDQFDWAYSSIKIGKMSFKNGIEVYHVFVGIDYVLSPVSK